MNALGLPYLCYTRVTKCTFYLRNPHLHLSLTSHDKIGPEDMLVNRNKRGGGRGSDHMEEE